MSNATILRDRMLDQVSKIEDPFYRALRGSRVLRELEFIRWCPFCQEDDHWNHEPRGACRSIERIYDEACRCLTR